MALKHTSIFVMHVELNQYVDVVSIIIDVKEINDWLSFDKSAGEKAPTGEKFWDVKYNEYFVHVFSL